MSKLIMRESPSSVSMGPLASKDKIKPVLMALEPLEKNIPRVRRMLHAARLWAPSTDVLPASFVTPVDFGWPIGLYAPMIENMESLSEKRLLPALRKLNPKLFSRTDILAGATSSQREAVRGILNLAKKENAQLMVVGTHGRRGFSRAVLGSFAEMIVSLSRVPTMVINDKTRVPKEIKRIFFPTDLSPESGKEFRSVLKIAQKFGAKVVLFHCYEMPAFFITPAPGYDARLMGEMMKTAEADQKNAGKAWVARANKQGVGCELVMNRPTEKLGRAILKYSNEKRADLIVLATKRGPMGQTFFGGDVREILCAATRPVVVIRGKDRRIHEYAF